MTSYHEIFAQNYIIGGLNTAVGMKYCMNDIDFYVQMLGEFVQGSDEIHSLKSSSETIGAQKLSDSAKALEDAAKEGSTDFISAHNEGLIGSLKITVSGILMAQVCINDRYILYRKELFFDSSFFDAFMIRDNSLCYIFKINMISLI